MNRLQRITFGLLLYYLYSLLPASAEIPNHHIFYRQDKRAPLTKIEIVFLGAGRNQENPSQIGLARTVSMLIWKSAKKQGYTDQLEALGTNLNIITDTSFQMISISTLSENGSKSIKIVKDLIQKPEFSNPNLEEVKRQLAADYQKDLRRKSQILMINFALAQTKGIKKRRSLKTLKNLSIQDITQYHARLLKTDVVFFKVISDLDSMEVAKLLRPITEERETGGFVHSLAHFAVDHNSGHSAFVFDYPNIKSVFCHWLIPCGSIGDEDYIPTMISSTLGDNMQGLIFRYFREELGLVYGPSSEVRLSDNLMFLQISADPQFHNSEELIVKMSDFIRGLSDNPGFWDTLKERREFYDIAYVYNLTPQRSLDREVSRAIYNRPIRKGGYDSVTDAEVRAFLEKFFVPENMIMIFVGPKDHIIDILNKHDPEVDIRVHDVKELIE